MVEVQVVAEAKVIRDETSDERLERLERDFDEQAAHFRKAIEALSGQVDEAIRSGLADYNADETALSAKQILPTLVGLAISGLGLVLQLLAHYLHLR